VAIAVAVATGRDPGRLPTLPSLGAGTDVYDGDVGDPFVLAPVRTGPYVVYGTNDQPIHVPTATSTDLIHWTAGPDALPTLPSWAAPDPSDSLTWAPSVLDTGHGYLLYVTVPDAATGTQCVAVEASPVPLGPFRSVGRGPIECQAPLGGSIDPSVVRDDRSGIHLLWKSDGNSIHQPASLWEQNLDRAGTALTGAPSRLLTADEPWQAGIIERPEAAPATGGGWWLFYSGNAYNSPAYGTGVAWCQTLAGPCRDTSRHAFLSGSAREFSAAGLNVFRTSGGDLEAAYATWTHPPRNGHYHCCRALVLAHIHHL
jgi:hypothetical protein